MPAAVHTVANDGITRTAQVFMTRCHKTASAAMVVQILILCTTARDDQHLQFLVLMQSITSFYTAGADTAPRSARGSTGMLATRACALLLARRRKGPVEAAAAAGRLQTHRQHEGK